MATANSIFRIHPEVLSKQNFKPHRWLSVKSTDTQHIVTQPFLNLEERESPPNSENQQMYAVTLPQAGSIVFTTIQESTTQVGVQFWCDENCGWAQIKIDDVIRWVGNTLNLKDYIEIYDLTNAQHTVKVESLGQKGSESGGRDVRIAGFGYGAVNSKKYVVYLPFIANGAKETANEEEKKDATNHIYLPIIMKE